ncbi:hypothetical protein HMPREF9457_00855 [Dorea formicigenerans 4_6_53AFAA]|jgi:gamma-glutamylcyclotransferase (GGCT)/AIG2-like uncharacterized protein YtfP|nr:hypothetical protein HMPREF9457_00855 [Dorea formicigenerans 4_6_53AFAA]
MKEIYYFAYGSNMNLDQMEYRCPDAEVVENVRLEGYRLAFCGRPTGSGVATILPEESSHVEGVLWKITPECERSLDFYEGYPHLYGKEQIRVKNRDGQERSVMVYTMNPPYKEQPSIPSHVYLAGILEGCYQNDLPRKPVTDAVMRTRKEVGQRQKGQKKEYQR